MAARLVGALAALPHDERAALAAASGDFPENGGAIVGHGSGGMLLLRAA